MKTQVLPVITTLLLISSCKQNEHSNAEIDEHQSTSEMEFEKENPNEGTFLPEQNIENDSLVIQLEEDLNELLSESIFTLEKKPIANRHVDNVIDTIVTRSYKNSEIESYKTSNGKEMIQHAIISNPDFRFLNSVRVGSSQEELEKETGIDIRSNLLRIGNSTGNIVFNFKIKNGKIQEIIYDGYVD